MAELESKRVAFQAKADALYSNNVNVKVFMPCRMSLSHAAQDIFQGFIAPCKDFLSMVPWSDFVKRLHCC